MPTNSSILGLFFVAVWFVYFYGANLAPFQWWGVFSFDSSELPIVTTYALYIPIFIGFMEEDPSFVLERNTETHQSLLGGQGEMQLNNIISKLKDKFGVEVEKVPQRIAYRETIKGSSDVQGKHKKQSGGAGQYGDVHIRFSPSEEEFEFVESLFGGSIPKNYVPAVEKGLRESLDKGPLAGCKVVNVKADLYDGSYHAGPVRCSGTSAAGEG